MTPSHSCRSSCEESYKTDYFQRPGHLHWDQRVHSSPGLESPSATAQLEETPWPFPFFSLFPSPFPAVPPALTLCLPPHPQADFINITRNYEVGLIFSVSFTVFNQNSVGSGSSYHILAALCLDQSAGLLGNGAWGGGHSHDPCWALCNRHIVLLVNR